MTNQSTLIFVAIMAMTSTACGAETEEPIRFEYNATAMDTCAETSIGFHPGSHELTGAAEDVLFETVDHAGADCIGASIEITSFRNDEGDIIADERAKTIEAAIVSNYDISDSRISKSVTDAPVENEVGRVAVRLMTEVPLED